MKRSLETKEFILQTALNLTSKFGLESLSICQLAKSVGMSKSGLFGHFKSKEKLQIMVLNYAAESFTEQVIKPAIKEPRGLPRLEAMMLQWKKWSHHYLAGGCPILSSIVEYDDRPGPVRKHVKQLQQNMIHSFEKAIIISQEESHLSRDFSAKQIAYEIYSNMIGYHIYSRLLNNESAHKMFLETYKKIIRSSGAKINKENI